MTRNRENPLFHRGDTLVGQDPRPRPRRPALRTAYRLLKPQRGERRSRLQLLWRRDAAEGSRPLQGAGTIPSLAGAPCPSAGRIALTAIVGETMLREECVQGPSSGIHLIEAPA